MTSNRKPYKTYTREFKLEAVRLMETSDRPAIEIARELGLRRNQLYKWKEQLSNQGETAFSGKRGRPVKAEQSEIVTLKQENERLKEELEIIKKAAVDSIDQRNTLVETWVGGGSKNETYVFYRRERVDLRRMEARSWV